MGGGARTGAGLALMLAALAAGHLALAAAAGSAVALAGVLALAGATIAPTYATIYAMVDHAAPAGTVTEAFAWLETAVAVGASIGAASAGAVAEAAGPAAAFARGRRRRHRRRPHRRAARAAPERPLIPDGRSRRGVSRRRAGLTTVRCRA